MNIELNNQDLSWIKRFFSGDNQLTWQSIREGYAPGIQLAQVLPWLSILSKGLISEFPIILPIYKQNGTVVWYGMAQNNQLFSQLCDEINSFIGSSYTDIKTLSFSNDNSDQEKAIIEQFGECVISFTANTTSNQSKIEESLLVYNKLLSRRPKLPNRMQRPFGKVRADFDIALLAGNSKNAEIFLDELIKFGRIDSAQQKCFEIRMLSGLGRQMELARNHPLICSVVDLQLPAKILIDIIDALYEIYIRPIEKNSDVTVIFKSFKQNILRPFGASLFKDRKGIRHPTILRLFLLFELVQDNPSRNRCDLILSAYPEQAEGRKLAVHWYEGLPVDYVNLQPTTSEQIIKQALVDEDYDLAYDLCLKWTSPNYWIYSTLIRCATELSDLKVKKKILDLCNSLPLEITSKFISKDLNRIENLKAVCEIQTIQESDFTWLVWAESVNKGATLSSSIKILDDYISKWSVDEYIYEQDTCANLARLIGNANTLQVDIYRAAFPFFVEFFVERPNHECRTFIPIYVAILEILALSGSLSPDELEIVFSITLVLLSTGISYKVYIETIDALQLIVKSNNSIVSLDWALNISELLIVYQSEDDGNSRLTLFYDVISIVKTTLHRVTRPQADLLELLAKDYEYDISALFPRDNCVDVSASNKAEFEGYIGIYTLTDGAGQRAKRLLEGYFPQAKVETNNDHEATEKLRSLAKNADIFVFAWKSSKHQAYFCVKDARQNKDIVLPLGKGTASIVKSTLDYINS